MDRLRSSRLSRGRRSGGAGRRAVSRAVELVESAGIPLLGVVGTDAASGRAVGELAVRLGYADEARRHRVLAVTSPGWREGTARLAADLAIVLAETGMTVVVVEADLHRPALADLLDVPRGPGLTDVIAGRTTADAAVRRWGSTGRLTVMTGGTPAHDLPGPFAGPRLAQTLADLSRRALVVVDAPAVLLAPEVAEVVSRADGVLLAVAAGTAQREEVRRVATRVGGLGTLLGAVVTSADEGHTRDDAAGGRAGRGSRGSLHGRHRAEPVLPSPFVAVPAAAVQPPARPPQVPQVPQVPEESVAPVAAIVAVRAAPAPQPKAQPAPQPLPKAQPIVTLPDDQARLAVLLAPFTRHRAGADPGGR